MKVTNIVVHCKTINFLKRFTIFLLSAYLVHQFSFPCICRAGLAIC